MAIHHLKVWPRFYRALADGSKLFEIRFNDRDFAIGCVLVFHEWDPDTSTYILSPLLYAKVMDILEDAPGLMEGYVIMTITEVRTT